jgi:hypothetical protein
MTAKERVLQKWPDAYCAADYPLNSKAPIRYDILLRSTGKYLTEPCKGGRSIDAAWASAAEKIAPAPDALHMPQTTMPIPPMAAPALCPQCGNPADDPREDSIERLLVCGDLFHKPAPITMREAFRTRVTAPGENAPSESVGALPPKHNVRTQPSPHPSRASIPITPTRAF